MSELIKVEEVVISQKGEQYLKEQSLLTEYKRLFAESQEQLREAIKTAALYKEEIDRLQLEALKASTKYEQVRMQLSTSNMHLFKMLDEMEGKFYVEQKFDSPDICRDYLDAALYCRKYFARESNLGTPEEAQQWYDNYSLPY